MKATQSFASTDMSLAFGPAIVSSSSGGAHANLFARRLAKKLQAPAHGAGEAKQQALLALSSASQGTPSFEAQRAVAMAFISRRALQGASLCSRKKEQHQIAHLSFNARTSEHFSAGFDAPLSGSTLSARVEASSLTDGVYDGLSLAYTNVPSPGARQEFSLQALGMQDYQHASPGPAIDLSSSSADFAFELNNPATTPGGATVYPWSAAATTPSSAFSKHQFPPSTSFAFASDMDCHSTFLDPRSGNPDADTGLRMLPKAPGFVSMTCGDSSAATFSASEPQGSGVSTSAGAGSSSSFTSSVSPFRPLNKVNHPIAAPLRLKEGSSGPLHTAQDDRWRSGPREQSSQTHNHLTSVPSKSSDVDLAMAAMPSGATAPARIHSRRTSPIDSHGRL